MADTLTLSRPWYRRARESKFIVEARRLPLLPMFLVVFILLVPAAFANLIAPHDPEVGVLPDRLIPPAWVKAKVLKLNGGFDFGQIKVFKKGELVPGAIVTNDGVPRVDGEQIRGIITYKSAEGDTIRLKRALLYPGGVQENIVPKIATVTSPANPISFTEGGLYVDGREVMQGVAFVDGLNFTPVGTMSQGMPAERALEVGNAQGNPVEGVVAVAAMTQVKMRGSEAEILARDGVVRQVARDGQGKYLLGTDKLGRDLVSRLIYGARVSLAIALISILFAGLLGTTLGLIAGFGGGWLDAVIMRLVDIMLSLPAILLALVLVAAIGPSFRTVILVIVMVFWSLYARQARGETLGLKERDFVARARVAGASNFRTITIHILPNLTNSLVVLATLQLGAVIIFEASLSFLGAGIPRPTPAWGVMVADGRELVVAQWWVSFFPGMAILLAVMSLNLMGDWVRDRLDPKMRQQL